MKIVNILLKIGYMSEFIPNYTQKTLNTYLKLQQWLEKIRNEVSLLLVAAIRRFQQWMVPNCVQSACTPTTRPSSCPCSSMTPLQVSIPCTTPWNCISRPSPNLSITAIMYLFLSELLFFLDFFYLSLQSTSLRHHGSCPCRSCSLRDRDWGPWHALPHSLFCFVLWREEFHLWSLYLYVHIFFFPMHSLPVLFRLLLLAFLLLFLPISYHSLLWLYTHGGEPFSWVFYDIYSSEW